MQRRLFLATTVLGTVLGAAQVFAHHSFAVFFDQEKIVSVTGTVKDFQFKNPHGVIRISAKNKDGVAEEWKAESNSPSILRRRGWTPDSLKNGETVTIEGWPARDGSRYMRMRSVTRANGEPVGKPFVFSED
jgi:hypothetical protein